MADSDIIDDSVPLPLPSKTPTITQSPALEPPGLYVQPPDVYIAYSKAQYKRDCAFILIVEEEIKQGGFPYL
jgi:hypothetical protein